MKKIYLFDIDEEKGIGCKSISHVESPAIESNFITFSEETEEDDFKFTIDNEKMRIAGPILIPNKPMYRKKLGGYVMFTPEAVERVRASYKKNNNNFATNFEHSDIKSPAFLIEDWIVTNPKNDKSNQFGEQPADTWFGIQQCTDKKYWDEKLKTGIVKGFSIEIDSLSAKIKEAFNMETNEVENKTEETIKTEPILDNKDAVAEVVKLAEELKKEVKSEEKTEEVTETVKLAEDIVTEEIKVEEEKKPEGYVTKEEVTNMLSDVLSRLEKLELELGKKEEEVEMLSKELEETRSNVPGNKSFVFNKEKKIIKKEEMSFSQKMKEKIFSQSN